MRWLGKEKLKYCVVQIKALLRIPIYRVPYFNGSPKAESDNLPVISDSIVSETCCDR